MSDKPTQLVIIPDPKGYEVKYYHQDPDGYGSRWFNSYAALLEYLRETIGR